jgi:hypothetical protein
MALKVCRKRSIEQMRTHKGYYIEPKPILIDMMRVLTFRRCHLSKYEHFGLWSCKWCDPDRVAFCLQQNGVVNYYKPLYLAIRNRAAAQIQRWAKNYVVSFKMRRIHRDNVKKELEIRAFENCMELKLSYNIGKHFHATKLQRWWLRVRFLCDAIRSRIYREDYYLWCQLYKF